MKGMWRFAAGTSRLASVLACTGLASIALTAPVATAQPLEVGGSAGPVPSAVAVANDGMTAAAGFGAPDVVALIPQEGSGLNVALGCPPVDVAIAPDAS